MTFLYRPGNTDLHALNIVRLIVAGLILNQMKWALRTDLRV